MSQDILSQLRTGEISVLDVDDALRLAKDAAIRGGIRKTYAGELYEKVVMEQISVLEYLGLLERSTPDETLRNVVLHIRDNVRSFR